MRLRCKTVHMYRLLFEQRRTLFTSKVRRKINEKLTDNAKVKTSLTKHQYSESILLPRTTFPAQLNGQKRIEQDEYLTTVGNLKILNGFTSVEFCIVYIYSVMLCSTEVWIFRII